MWEQRDSFCHGKMRAVGLLGGLKCDAPAIVKPVWWRNELDNFRVL